MISETFECPANYFKCQQSFCLDTQYVCDGIAQCADGEDEEECGRYNATRISIHLRYHAQAQKVLFC